MTQDQFAFIHALSSEICLNIFSYLNQQDCLTCMAVCRDWYNAIPQYTQPLWKELHLDSQDINKNHKRRNYCLGHHVKTVTLQALKNEKDQLLLCTLVKQLITWKCSDVLTVELKGWEVTDQDAFFTLLKQLAPRITHLKLDNVTSSIVPTAIIDACPTLTHFTCDKTIFTEKGDHDQAVNYSPSNITHLVLDAILCKKQYEDTLKRCPDLRSLIGVSNFTWYKASTQTDIHLFTIFDDLFTWCPKIACFVSGGYGILSHLENQQSYISDKIGLRYLHTPILDSNYRQIVSLWVDHQKTLEFLKMDVANISVSDQFISLEFPRLRSLILETGSFSSDSLVALLNHCPALEILHLKHKWIEDPTPTRPLTFKPNLKELSWDLRGSLGGLTLLMFFEQCPALEELYVCITNGYYELPEGFMGLRNLKKLDIADATKNFRPLDYHTNPEMKSAMMRFFGYLAENAKLESIRISGMQDYGYEALQRIAAIPTLKFLTIDPGFQDEQEFEGFIQLLGRTSIETLSLRKARQPTSSVLDGLTKLPRLRGLSMDFLWDSSMPTTISKEGLQKIWTKNLGLECMSLRCILVCDESGRQLEYDEVHDLLHWQEPKGKRRLESRICGHGKKSPYGRLSPSISVIRTS